MYTLFTMLKYGLKLKIPAHHTRKFALLPSEPTARQRWRRLLPLFSAAMETKTNRSQRAVLSGGVVSDELPRGLTCPPIPINFLSRYAGTATSTSLPDRTWHEWSRGGFGTT